MKGANGSYQMSGWRELFLLASVLMVPVSKAWAFDCSKVRTSTEKAICADTKLKALDYQINRDYRAFVKYHKATGHYNCLLEDEAERQKQWLLQRDACGGDAPCIQKAYQNRLAALNRYTRVCVAHDDRYPDRPCSRQGGTTSTAPATEKCPEGERIDFNFVSTGEGGQALSAYVPGGYYTHVKKNGPPYVYPKLVKPSHRKISASSGVTVDTGVDLAHQSSDKLRKTLQSYISKHGNPGHVKVDDLLEKLSPFMDKKLVGQKAFEKIVGREQEITEAQADLLRDANAEQVYIPMAESNFNKHNQMGITFKQLPAGIQTVLVDWSWQFYSADEVYKKSRHGNNKAVESRKEFWSLVYAGDWNQLANKLERADFARRGNGYDARYHARGKRIREAIKGGWPSKGSAC